MQPTVWVPFRRAIVFVGLFLGFHVFVRGGLGLSTAWFTQFWVQGLCGLGLGFRAQGFVWILRQFGVMYRLNPKP